MPIIKFPTAKSEEMEIENEMVKLYQSINSLRSTTQQKNKIIQFMSNEDEDGTSTIVRELAKVATTKYNKSVLILDADLRKLDQQPFFNITLEQSLEETIRAGDPIDKAIYQIENSSLFLGRLFKDSGSINQFLEPSDIDDLLEKLRKRFDFIFIDAPPDNLFSISLATSTSVNGIVMVLDAEKSCLDMAQKTKDKIIKSGGKILGIVINKQRNYIPEFINKRI